MSVAVMRHEHLDMPNECSGLRRWSTRNVEEHARCFSGWEMRYNQVTPGLFEGRITELDLDGMQLIRDRANQAMVKSGQSWDGAIAFSLPLAVKDQAFYCDGRVINVQSVLAGSGDQLPDLRTPADLDLLCVAVDKSLLETMLAQQKRDLRLDLSAVAGCFQLANFSCREELATLIDSVTDGEGPALLAHAAIRAGIRDTVLLHLLDLIDSEEVTPLSSTTRKRIVDRACEFALSNRDNPPSIMDLCNHVGASRRKLQYCFQETLGVNPVAYLRILRLNAVHRALLQADATMTVQDVAANWGFWHLSRFAAEYRQLFGERPSDTLGRARQYFADFG